MFMDEARVCRALHVRRNRHGRVGTQRQTRLYRAHVRGDIGKEPLCGLGARRSWHWR